MNTGKWKAKEQLLMANYTINQQTATETKQETRSAASTIGCGCGQSLLPHN